MFKRFLCSALAIVLATFVFSGCGAEKQKLLIAHNQKESHPVHTGIIAFKNYVESRLGDKFEIVIYPSEALGPNEKVMEQIKEGSVHFLVISSANLESFDRIYSLFSIPYIFNSEEIYERFISDPNFIDILNTNSLNQNFTPLTAFTSGTRNFYAVSPIHSVADLQGKRIRIQASPVNVAMIQAFGATAVPMTYSEVYPTLQRKIIDGAENNEFALTDFKHGEVAPYYSYDMHQMCPDMLIGSNKFLATLSESERKIFTQAAQDAQRTEFNAWHTNLTQAKKQAQAMGVQFINVDINEFRQKVLPLQEQILSENPALNPLYEAASKFNDL